MTKTKTSRKNNRAAKRRAPKPVFMVAVRRGVRGRVAMFEFKTQEGARGFMEAMRRSRPDMELIEGILI